ncbi:hypothetical protein ACFY9G_23140 [Streptomyces anthocyanicus]|uniref:hypothetical protein n=2 Tax=Streptomyces TaxID=1883 RepID=UPI0036EF84BA|nr:hypothetical protein OHA15_33730 [Streptomyces anthocyanicus]
MERLLELRAVERRSLQHHLEDVLRRCQHRLENWRVDFYCGSMTDAFTESLEAKVAEVEAIDDLLARGRAALEARQALAASDQALYAIQQAAVQGLYPGRTWAQVGELFGRTHAWAEAIARGRSSKRRKSDHAVQPTPNARAAEGHAEDTGTP